ncbi:MULTISPECIES: gluconokinase [unclassified Campylobacter]|uniref:gluconokinase n=1 Tax=unclassified Campylobacter TaxID=2593542 RepID=UPI001BDB2DCF|nr:MULTISPECIES: gluconokinase [unclassified Campylobacter]MBZ7978619.1 gluconokinase [Campylobacter sp. RM12654]MBZ7991821.1 gluconokinase [Campylobacter sp. RM9331]MBZ7993620.1 gluconokinase [Campylobacter sp. RM9333]MBZ8006102.1 gluconokinase [Campylobacter sp. RM9332]MBT0879128.1 gluconokinase [Campylobacter sp. 2018MI01]
MKHYNIVVMGVCGCGKSTVGAMIANSLGASFIDGDDLHPRANIEKMQSGVPLNDLDREPWLERIADVFYSISRRNRSCVIACSALKKQYRDKIRQSGKIIFIHLHGSKELIMQRMSKRSGHYMKENMIDSQFSTLEFPHNEDLVINIDITPPIGEIVEDALIKLDQL